MPPSGRDGYFTWTLGAAAVADADAPPAAKGGASKSRPTPLLRKRLRALGNYADVVSSEPLSSSTDEFDSCTGWPSFTLSLAPGSNVTVTETTLGMVRVEVRSRHADLAEEGYGRCRGLFAAPEP